MNETPFKLELAGKYSGQNGLTNRAFRHTIDQVSAAMNGKPGEGDFVLRYQDSEDELDEVRGAMGTLLEAYNIELKATKNPDPAPSVDPSRISAHEWDGLWTRLARGEGVQTGRGEPTKINLRPGTIGKSLPDRDESVGQYLLSDDARSSLGFDTRVDLQPWAQRFGHRNNFFPDLRANPLELPGAQSSISDPIALAKMPVSVRRALLRGEELNSVDLTNMDPKQVKDFLLAQAGRKDQVVLVRSEYEIMLLTPETRVTFTDENGKIIPNRKLKRSVGGNTVPGVSMDGSEDTEYRSVFVPFDRLFIFAQ